LTIYKTIIYLSRCWICINISLGYLFLLSCLSFNSPGLASYSSYVGNCPGKRRRKKWCNLSFFGVFYCCKFI